ncbi:hypothetical protein SEVIR_7G026052v4 [Setaria viridis]
MRRGGRRGRVHSCARDGQFVALVATVAGSATTAERRMPRRWRVPAEAAAVWSSRDRVGCRCCTRLWRR